MIKTRGALLYGIVYILVSSCAAPLKTSTVSFKTPSSYPNYHELDGLHIAINPLVDKKDCESVFGTDLREAEILPVQIIVHNTGRKEYEIDDQQVFGVEPNGVFTQSYSIVAGAEKVRASSIGTTVATGATVGALLGAAMGASLGAAAGSATGDAGAGAAAGAALGGATGAVAGTGAGMSDVFTLRFKRELAQVAFGDRAIYPGDIHQGFVYLPWKHYSHIRLKVLNVTDNSVIELKFPIHVSRYKNPMSQL